LSAPTKAAASPATTVNGFDIATSLPEQGAIRIHHLEEMATSQPEKSKLTDGKESKIARPRLARVPAEAAPSSQPGHQGDQPE
jgi:hypothetical protein